MLKTLAIIGGVIVVAVVIMLIYAATRPDSFRVQRSASIKAPPEKVFPLLNDFHRYGEWSPFEKMDADMKRTYSGANTGKGAAYAWESTGKAGIGRMEITDSSPSSIKINLDFVKPFTARNKVEYTLQPKGDTTDVTWAMHGDSPYISKLMGIFFNFDKLIGSDFETGLANIKAIAEK